MFEPMASPNARKVVRDTFDWGFISTVSVTDGRKTFETAIKHPEYNGGDMVIVDCYDTVEEAEAGHRAWVKTMENPPEELIDIANSEIQQAIGKETFKRIPV